ncbi:GspH/FimT family protein [Litoribacillus peritrichatus]|uniref:Type II secretion system protein H n=1 Tax=Litoribacillus peritrichatus TaxID=718191 RepID=A0ABP7MSW0_9GAMM
MSQKGFTLVELMVVLAVVAVTFTFAIPAMKTIIQNNNVSGETNRLAASIRYARSEAVTRNQIITLSNKGGISQWRGGWEIFVDASGGNSHYKASEDVLVRREVDAHPTVSLKSTKDGENWLSFNADGSLRENNDVTFFVCDSKQSVLGNAITISRTGRVMVRGNIAHVDCKK